MELSAHRALLVAVFGAAALAPPGASGQENGWVVGGHDVSVAVEGTGGAASISSRIHLQTEDPEASPDADASLTIELLLFGDVAISDLRRADGDRILMWPASGRRMMATIGPPFAREDGRPYVDLSYTVEGAVTGEGVDRRVQVPVVSGPVRPGNSEGNGAEAFTAAIDVPDAWRVSESFPTGLAPDGGDGALRVTLPVTPAMIAFRARTDGSWRPGVPLVIDVLTVVFLLGFAAFGWRHLRGVVAGRQTAGEVAG